MKDLGEEASQKSKGLVALSKCQMTTSERDVEVLTRRYGLRIPIPLTSIPKTRGVRFQGDFTVLALRSWAQWIVDFNLWHVMCGLNAPDPRRERAILTEFWRRYKVAFPNHQLWELVQRKNIDISRVCPMIFHGDEGRGRKRAAFLVCQYHSFLGKGTLSANAARVGKPYRLMRLNYSGNSWTHRLLTAVLPKMVKDEVALKDILRHVTQDSLSMINEGVLSCHGERFYMVTLQVCGDWAFLAKAGQLARSFSNVQKRPHGVNSVPKGVCHYCKAGQLEYPFEDFNANPCWRPTMFQADDVPFTEPPVLLKLHHLPTAPAKLFIYDIWHAYHLGLAKTFLASVLALVSDRMLGGNIEMRFDQLTREYLLWCDETKTSSFLTGITKETLGWPDRKTFPNGQWSKGHISTALHSFLKSWFSLHANDLAGDTMLMSCMRANTLIGAAFEELYANDVWLSVEVAKRISAKALQFLRIYMSLAKQCFDDGKAFFPYMPKGHVVHHVFLAMKEEADAGESQINPMVYGVQVDEDFVGKSSRLSRRVGAGQVVKRVLQRSLCAAHRRWIEAGSWWKG